MNKQIWDSINKLDLWIEKNGWAGYDPYDIKELKFVRFITESGKKNVFGEVVREAVFEIFYTFPITSRKIFNVEPRINAKAIALFARGYLDLFLVSQDEKYLSKSNFCINWLEENCSVTAGGIGWGYPFDWQSNVLIPKYTPNGIVTTAAGDAFWAWYQYTGEQKYLDVCNDICRFLITLPVDDIADDQICFAYTPLFCNHVHNLNLFVAEYLIKVGKELNISEWVNIGQKAVNYTVTNQSDDGSFDYNGPPEKPQKFSDNYHTGFVLRMLHSIWKMTADKSVYNSLKKCYLHYVTNFFENGKIPKLLPDRKYRVDIHSCAESINCLSQLSVTFPEALETAVNILDWTISNMQDETGYFYYAFLKSRFTGIVFKSKIPYIRWSQAWMIKGLSNYLLKVMDL